MFDLDRNEYWHDGGLPAGGVRLTTMSTGATAGAAGRRGARARAAAAAAAHVMI